MLRQGEWPEYCMIILTTSLSIGEGNAFMLYTFTPLKFVRSKKSSLKKILLVDEDENFLWDLSGALGGRYEVYCASSSPEAFYLFKKLEPDLCIIDLKLPPLIGDQSSQEGLELARRFMQCNPDFNGFIFMSSESFPESNPDFIDYNFLHKPFVLDRLLNALDLCD